MNYIVIAISAYFLLALSYVLDKFLLSDRIPRPSVYAFYVALLSFVTIILAPLGLHWQGGSLLMISLFSGASYIYAILFLYRAVKINEISRVAPLVGSVMTIATLLVSIIFLGSDFTALDLGGILLLLIGGFLISFDLPIKSLKIFNGFYNSIAGGIFFALSYLCLNYVYDNDGFISGFIWTRMGLFLGGLSLLLISAFRKEIVASFSGIHENRKKNLTTSVIFIGNKIIGGSHSFILNYAFYLGGMVAVAIINALSSVQFVFILALATLASIKFPKLFGEKLFFWDWAQKIGAILLIGVGIIFISI